jgi:protein O-mannosyl-transferase
MIDTHTVMDHTENKIAFFRRPAVWIYLFLTVATLVIYSPVRNHEFINYDDATFITDNRLIQSGLTLESIQSAFKNNWGYWKPLSYLSLMLDHEIYGMDPGGFHMTNLLFHIANSLLLFIVLRRTTQAMWQSAFVAALFALHPLRVESVAWVTERKDVLSTFFWFITILAYIYYLKRPKFKRYLGILIALALGLLAKPMLVTLPFVLLLFDYWPLGRLQLSAKSNLPDSSLIFIRNLSRLIWEKLPMFILVAVFILILLSFRAGQQFDQPAPFSSFGYKTSNALISSVKYIEKMVWPRNLAIPYPYKAISWQETALSALIVFCISFAAAKAVRSRPYFIIGWLWYLGTLVPASGVVYFCSFPMADRFTYVPQVGLFIIIAWGVPELLAQWRHKTIILSTLAVVLLTILMAVTWKQVGYWKNSITLFQHTLNVTTNNALPHHNLASALAEQGQTVEAIHHYSEALRIKPDYEKAHNNLGVAFVKQARIDEAIEHYLKALEINPNYAEAQNNLGMARDKQGRTAEAIAHYVQALRIRPDFAEVHNNLGVARGKQGRTAEAIDHYVQALRIKPDYPEAHNNLGGALDAQGQSAKAIDHYLQALRIRPDYEKAYNNLGVALVKQGRIDEAIVHYLKALRIQPDYAKAHNNLGVALVKQGRIDEAIVHYLKALRIQPDYVDAYNNLGVAVFRQGNIEEALAHFREALRISPDHGDAKSNLEKVLMIRQPSND